MSPSAPTLSDRLAAATALADRITAAHPELGPVAARFAGDDRARAWADWRARFPGTDDARPAAPAPSGSGFARVLRPEHAPHVFPAAPYYRPGDTDDGTFPDPAGPLAVDLTAQAARLYAEVVARETGREANTERDLAREKEIETLKRQTHDFALLLEQGGVEAYRRDAWAIWRFRPLSGTWEEIAKWRRSMLLPAVAAMIRASLIRALECFLEGNPFARFFTFTSGQRVTLAQLSGRLDDHFAELSRLNTWLKARWGWHIVFRSTELGTPETDHGKRRKESEQGQLERDEKGQVLFHPHTHAVLIGPYLPPAKWSKMLAEIWDHWGHFWDEGGMVREVRECCKYLTKPAEMLALTPDEAAGLYRALYRRKIVCPLAELRDDIRRRDAAGLTLRRKKLDNGEGFVWREELDNNKHRAKATRDARDAAAGEKLGKARAGGCYVVSCQVPTRGPLGLTEPSCIVMGLTRDEAAIRREPCVREMVAAAMPAWVRAQLARKAGAGASPVRVHTCTPTPTFQTAADFLHDVEPRHAPPGPPVWAAILAENL